MQHLKVVGKFKFINFEDELCILSETKTFSNICQFLSQKTLKCKKLAIIQTLEGMKLKSGWVFPELICIKQSAVSNESVQFFRNNYVLCWLRRAAVFWRGMTFSAGLRLISDIWFLLLAHPLYCYYNWWPWVISVVPDPVMYNLNF